MQLFDTHCHIQSAGLTVGERSTRELWAKAEADITVDSVIKRARAAQVQKMICVGCDLTDSQLAVEVARSHDDIYASIGLHPHEAQHYAGQDAALQAFARLAEDVSVVAIGECGEEVPQQPARVERHRYRHPTAAGARSRRSNARNRGSVAIGSNEGSQRRCSWK